MTNLTRGIHIIQSYASKLSSKPGVYRMIDDQNNVLYVGKAKNLKSRVISYTHPEKLSLRIQRMVGLTKKMEFITTHTESEALLLEVNLIKELKPRFNVLFTDDKSFPYLLLTKTNLPSRICSYRGDKKKPGHYFGPFSSGQDVQKTIDVLTKVFRLRTCSDSFFLNRTRPCLQYHIKRCTAPCVQKISWEKYEHDINQAKKFLEGQNQKLQQDLSQEMQQASKILDFEKAAQIRDQIQSLTKMQEEQSIFVRGIKNLDVIALVQIQNKTAVQIFFFRNGAHYGSKIYFPQHTKEESIDSILEAFISWFYISHQPPSEIVLNHTIDLKNTFTTSKIATPQKGIRKRLLQQAERNAKESLSSKLQEEGHLQNFHNLLQNLLKLTQTPNRIEIYDNSHLQGTHAYGVMVVATLKGFIKKSYRRFSMADLPNNISRKDDYGMMRHMLWRRFYQKDTEAFPDLIILDGGKGQLSAGKDILKQLNLEIPIISIAKGEQRNAGQEIIYLSDGLGLKLAHTHPLLYYLQRLRDESHRFAIGTHRYKRNKASTRSALDEIKGIGPKRKKQLLNHFGSVRAIMGAGIPDLEKVNGISKQYAKIIYDCFHH